MFCVRLGTLRGGCWGFILRKGASASPGQHPPWPGVGSSQGSWIGRGTRCTQLPEVWLCGWSHTLVSDFSAVCAWEPPGAPHPHAECRHQTQQHHPDTVGCLGSLGGL